MRGVILPGMVAAFLLGWPAHAAPTCQTRAGDTIRCGGEGAMPVGWTIALEERIADPLGGNGKMVLKTVLGLGLFLAFIALLPQFDGNKAGDWDGQADDSED